jgi:hypothetical protein
MNNDETFWMNAVPFIGVRTSAVIRTGSEFYWMNGFTSQALFPVNNIDTGKFIIMFE